MTRGKRHTDLRAEMTEHTPLTATPPDQTVPAKPLGTALPTAAAAHDYTEGNGAVSAAVRRFVGAPRHVSLLDILSELAVNAAPAALTMLLFFGNQAITTMYVGHKLGTVALAQYTVGQSVFNACGLSLAHGMATALDTLCSQSYGRSQQGPELGELFQRSLVVCIGMNIPGMIFFYYCDPVVIAVFGPEVGHGVAQFLHWCPIYLVLVTVDKCLQKTLQAQKLPRIPFAAAFVATLSCIFFNSYWTHRGLLGALLAIMFTEVVMISAMFVMSLLHPAVIIYQAKFPAPRAIEWEGIKTFVRVGFPSLFSICSEWWVMQILIALVATLGAVNIAAFTIAFNVFLLLFAMPQGLSVGVAVLVGNAMGAHDAAAARAVTRLALLTNAVLSVCNACVLYFAGDRIFQLYTADPAVHVELHKVLWGVIAFQLADSTQSGMLGAFRGVGRQFVCARVVLVTLWMVGLPASFLYVTELRMGLVGVFLGCVTGIACEVPCLLYDILFNWDWDALAADANSTTRLASPTPSAHPAFPDHPSYGSVDLSAMSVA
jgi:MATE family multidrug resistance protein